MDVAAFDLFFHVLEVHAPDSVGVLYQRGMHNMISTVGQTVRKADVGRRMKKNIVPFGAENTERGEHASQDTVFIADALSCQPGNAVAALVPFYDLLIVFLSDVKISISGVPGPFDYGFGNRGACRKIHVGDPHRDYVVSFIGSGRYEGSISFSKQIHCDRVHAAPVHD